MPVPVHLPVIPTARAAVTEGANFLPAMLCPSKQIFNHTKQNRLSHMQDEWRKCRRATST